MEKQTYKKKKKHTPEHEWDHVKDKIYVYG